LSFTLLELSGERAKTAIMQCNSLVLANIISSSKDFPYKSFSEVPLEQYEEYGFVPPLDPVFTFQLNYLSFGPAWVVEDSMEIAGIVSQVFTHAYTLDPAALKNSSRQPPEMTIFRFSPYRVFESLEEAAYAATETVDAMGFVIENWQQVQVVRVSDSGTSQDTLFWDGEDLVPEVPAEEKPRNV
jgi:hypothetical protein